MKLSHLVARAINGAIGYQGALPWHISADLKRFKALTLGKAVIMGRKTHVSIGKALPGRLNVVLSRAPQSLALAPEVLCAASLAEALELIKSSEWPTGEVFIIGGGELYAQTLDLVEFIYLTEVALSPPADAFYPQIPERFKLIAEEAHLDHSPAFSFKTFAR